MLLRRTSLAKFFSTIAVIGLLLAAPSSPLFAEQGRGNDGEGQQLTNNPANYECDLSGTASSGLPACRNDTGGGTKTSLYAVSGNNSGTSGNCNTTTLCGAKSRGISVAPIVAWGVCYWVDNTGTDSIFVPFKTASEWSDFKNSNPANINFVECSLPPPPSGGSVSVSPPRSYPGPLGAITVTLPSVYGRADSTVPLPASNSSSLWPSDMTTRPVITGFTSNGGATSLTAREQWRGGSATNTAWVPTFAFSPNLVFTATNTTNGGAAGTAITATIGDELHFHYSGVAADNSSIVSTETGGSPHGWTITTGGTTTGTNIIGEGSVTVTTVGTETFTIRTVDTQGLVSVATVTVIVQPLGACGSDGSQAQATAIPLSSAPSSYCQSGNNLVANSLVTNPEGWSWQCQPNSGGGKRNCYAIQAAKCGSGVQYDASGKVTSGTQCDKGTGSAIDVATGAYSCTTTMGTASNSLSCSATVGDACQANANNGGGLKWISDGIDDYSCNNPDGFRASPNPCRGSCGAAGATCVWNQTCSFKHNYVCADQSCPITPPDICGAGAVGFMEVNNGNGLGTYNYYNENHTATDLSNTSPRNNCQKLGFQLLGTDTDSLTDPGGNNANCFANGPPFDALEHGFFQNVGCWEFSVRNRPDNLACSTAYTAKFYGNPSCVTPAACGTANNQSFSSAPSTNLCKDGTASAVTGAGPWSWTCSGTNAGNTASCRAIPANSFCGSADGGNFDYAPTANLCPDGSTPPVTVGAIGQWAWNCGGNACKANITTPTLHAGCDVQHCKYENCYLGLVPANETSSSCSSYGVYPVDNPAVISASVGTTMVYPLTDVGNQSVWQFTPADAGRFTVQWFDNNLAPYSFGNQLPIYSSSCSGLQQTNEGIVPSCQSQRIWRAPNSPNGGYSAGITVIDTYNNSTTNLSISATRDMTGVVPSNYPPD